MGWSLLSVTLGRWSSLGYLEGAIGGEYNQPRTGIGIVDAHGLEQPLVYMPLYSD